jgi:thioredoxin-like negative regulator of GroEL
MKFKLLILILLGAFIGFSALYSGKFYTFYLKGYHVYFKKESLNDMIKNAESIKKEKNNKNYKNYCEKILLVYPSSPEAKIYAGRNFLKIGEEDRGSELIVTAMNEIRLKDEELEQIIEILFEKKYYGEVIDAIEKNKPQLNRELEYYYGFSLLKTVRSMDSIDHFEKSRARGNDGFDLNMNLAKAYESNGRLNDALKCYLAADSIKPRDRILRESLVEIYTKLGKYDSAERILRKKK